jgi:hypothetical protein
LRLDGLPEAVRLRIVIFEDTQHRAVSGAYLAPALKICLAAHQMSQRKAALIEMQAVDGSYHKLLRSLDLPKLTGLLVRNYRCAGNSS